MTSTETAVAVVATLMLLVGMACATLAPLGDGRPVQLALRSREPGQLVMALRVPPAEANRLVTLQWQEQVTLAGGSTDISLRGAAEPGSLYLREVRVGRGIYDVEATLWGMHDTVLARDRAQVIVK